MRTTTRIHTMARRASVGICVTLAAAMCGLMPGVASAVGGHFAGSPTSALPDDHGLAPVPSPRPEIAGCSAVSRTRAVVLFHGERSTGSDLTILANSLRARGHCVMAPTYGIDASDDPSLGGMAPAYRSADDLLTYLQGVYAELGRRVSVVGVGAGGVLAHHLIAAQGASSLVDTLVTLGSPVRGWQHASASDDVEQWEEQHLGALDGDMRADSEFMHQLRSMPMLNSAVRYAAFASTSDMLATEASGTMWAAREVPGGVRLWSLRVQEACPGVQVSHDDLVTSPAVADLVAVGVDPSSAGRVRPACVGFSNWSKLGLSTL